MAAGTGTKPALPKPRHTPTPVRLPDREYVVLDRWLEATAERLDLEIKPTYGAGGLIGIAIKRINMGRFRRLAYSVSVALLVFLILAVPVLSQLYGPVVYLPIYGFISLVVGSATWWVLRKVTRSKQQDREFHLRSNVVSEQDNSQEVDVAAEMDQLRDKED